MLRSPAFSSQVSTSASLAFLVVLAGATDSLMFSHSSELLAVYMSGNTSHLGVYLAQQKWQLAAPLASVVATFFVSATAGAWMGQRLGPWRGPVVLTITTLFLFVAGSLARKEYSLATVLCIAIAMGLLNQVLAKELGVTFITGSLIRLSRAIVERNTPAILNGVTHGVAWVAGAMTGAFMDRGLQSPTLLYLASAGIAGAFVSAAWISSRGTGAA